MITATGERSIQIMRNQALNDFFDLSYVYCIYTVSFSRSLYILLSPEYFHCL